MCPKTSGISRTPANQKIKPEILDKIITEVVPHISRIDLVGDGEILLDLDAVKKILEAAKRQHVLVNASTNGILMTREAAEMLITGGLHDLNISLDAATPETYQSIRGADFAKLLENIRVLNELKKAYHTETPYLHFSMVGMKRNIRELPDLIRIAHQNLVKSVTLQAMGEFRPVEKESVFLRDKALGRDCLIEARRVGAELGVSVELWPDDQFHEAPLSTHPNLSKPDRTVRFKDCYFPWDVPYFATDGSVRPCCAMPPMGNLHEQSFLEIWHGPRYRDLRSRMKTPTPPPECVTCPGRGWYTPFQVLPILKIGQHDRQLGLGWFEIEHDASGPFRWARESATFFLKGNNEAVIEMELESALNSGTTQTIHVTIDNSCNYLISFKNGNHRRVFLPLPDSGPMVHTITLSGTPWKPVDLQTGMQDPRKLSIKFFGASLSGTHCHSTFDRGIELIACDFPPKISRKLSHVPVTLYWSCTEHTPDNLKLFLHVFTARDRLFQQPNLVIQDLLRAVRPEGQKFQSDIRFNVSINSQELAPLDVSVAIPSNIASGSFQMLLGLYHPDGKRLAVKQSPFPIYRNGILLGQFQIHD